MPDFPGAFRSPPAGALNNWDCIGGSLGLGNIGAPTVSNAWPAANRALYFPILVETPVTVRRLGWFNGATVSGNVDAGVYDLMGTRLVSTGSTAGSGTSTPQSVSVTATTLNPGTYFLALACDNTTATFYSRSGGAFFTGLLRAFGVQQQASAFALPSTATFANPASAYVPLVIASPLTVI